MDANASNYDPSGPQGGDSGYYYEYGQQPQQPQPQYFPDPQQPIMTEGYDSVYGHPNTYSDANYFAAAEGAGLSQDGYYVDPSVSQQDMESYTEPGSYYPIDVLHTQIPSSRGDTVVSGDPVTAIAYDATHAAMYVASACHSIGGLRWQQRFNDHKASMLYTYSYSPSSDGSHDIMGPGEGRSLYASVAGHPQAPDYVLTKIYDTIFTFPGSKSSTARPQVPSHAYRPPFSSVADKLMVTFPKKAYHMGITTLLPALDGQGNGGYVASVSPSAVRLHAHGGYQVSDRHMEGMMCGTSLPNSHGTHIVVGGMAIRQDPSLPSSNNSSFTTSRHEVHCLDLWQGLRTVASYSVNHFKNRSTDTAPVAVTSLASCGGEHLLAGSIVAGCSDGYVRLLDGRRMRDTAKIKSHMGGVVNVAVSNDGTMLATTGYGSRGSTGGPLYSFPDPTVFLYDIRYLGRGGIPHAFAGLRGGPRHVSFVPDVEGQPPNRLLVASGQSGGGLQLIEPFQEASDKASNFILPQLDRDSITAMCVFEDTLSLGTSQGLVMNYRLAGYSPVSSYDGRKGDVFVPRGSGLSGGAKSGSHRSSFHSSDASAPSNRKVQLDVPSYTPIPPPLSLEASMLMGEDPKVRPGLSLQVKSLFSTYLLGREPRVTPVRTSEEDPSLSTFGPLSSEPLVDPSRLTLSQNLLGKVEHAVDFLQTARTSDLEIDLLADQRSDRVKEHIRRRYPVQPNPNKLLYANKVFSAAYEDSLNRTKRLGHRSRGEGRSGQGADKLLSVPTRYRLTIRPCHRSAASFSHSDYNETGFVPGWDYPASMPNAFVPPVLMLIYFLQNVRSALFSDPFLDKALVPSMDRKNPMFEKYLLPELGFVFHRIDNLSRYAMLFPASAGGLVRVEAWAPNNFIAYLAALPEAEQLQILDNSPAAVDSPRRAEAFYRFLLYQLDKEVGSDDSRLLDKIGGMSFVCINEYISGSDAPTEAKTRMMIVDIAYDSFLSEEETAEEPKARFADVLQRTLCNEKRLRAWSQGAKAYETIVQRKIATSLPEVLSLSCACAGRKDEEGLCLWRGTSCSDNEAWLPEMIEVELSDSANVIVREFVEGTNGNPDEWVECSKLQEIPTSVSDIVTKLVQSSSSARKVRYRLEAVLSLIRDDMDRNASEFVDFSDAGPVCHHILHARVGPNTKKNAMRRQIIELEKALMECKNDELSSHSTIMGSPEERGSLEKRLELAKDHLSKLQGLSTDNEVRGDEWICVNGYVVSNSTIGDVRDFSAKYREPSLVIYRSIESVVNDGEESEPDKHTHSSLPAHVLNTNSLTSSPKSLLAPQSMDKPSFGKLLAFDAEFVSVGEEDAALTEAGSKVILRETRYAVARISVIDCVTNKPILDDYVLPREPVVDYLTRFSGVVPKDLDVKQSPHHLIGPRAAYMKLRYLLENGHIFVGHGLKQGKHG